MGDPYVTQSDAALGLDALVRQASAAFGERFGSTPRWLVASPGRVNIIGEHVDYNDGFVLPMAIERHIVLAAAPRANAGGKPVARVASTRQQGVLEIDLRGPLAPAEPMWGNYVRGVIAGFQQRGIDIPSFDALIAADLPTGGGLSSSAALEVAVATLLETITGHTLDPREKALLCQHAEHTFAGVPCGIMDQFACTLGRRDHLLLLDCWSQDVQWVPMSDPSVTVLVIDSRVKHELTGGEYAKRRRDCEAAAAALGIASLRDLSPAPLEAQKGKLSDVQYRRARHVVTEIGRTTAAVAAIRAGDWPRVGNLLYESHASLRDDYEVSCAELDLIVDLARQAEAKEPGRVIGCRMTGGGFGGSAVCLVHTAAVDAVTGFIATEYERQAGIAPAIFATRPAQGAHVCEEPG